MTRTTASAVASSDVERFHDNGDGTVTDTTTGLMWTKATVATSKTHRQALAAVKKLSTAGHSDWRLPTAEDLLSLVDRSRYAPAIDADAFPDTRNDWYWTSTPSAWAPGASAWIVLFSNGGANGSGRNGNACVRAVRSVPAGQCSLPSALSDARMITAAPEMYSALSAFVAKIDDDGEPLPGTRFHAAYTAARAALLKAGAA